jgi:hypothetical protein
MVVCAKLELLCSIKYDDSGTGAPTIFESRKHFFFQRFVNKHQPAQA